MNSCDRSFTSAATTPMAMASMEPKRTVSRRASSLMSWISLISSSLKQWSVAREPWLVVTDHWPLIITAQQESQFVQVVLRGEFVINQSSLGVRQHFGLRDRHARLGQVFHKRMGIKTDCAHLLR